MPKVDDKERRRAREYVRRLQREKTEAIVAVLERARKNQTDAA